MNASDLTAQETVYHVTVLSNFARGYDKYTRTFSKDGIPESRFPDRFYVLARHELGIGISKASGLLSKLDLPGNQLIAIETRIATADLKANTTTGLGRYVESNQLGIKGIYSVDVETNELTHLPIEEVASRSLLLLNPTLIPFEELQPRSVSLLPLAKACQAKCRFCFSAASVSADQVQDTMDLKQVARIFQEGKARGAERVVITGGGEPGLLPHARLLEMVALSASYFPK
ncbi:radical SAM protein, partial [bacterium]